MKFRKGGPKRAAPLRGIREEELGKELGLKTSFFPALTRLSAAL